MQLSELESTTSFCDIVAFPVASKYTVKSLVANIGAISSITVTFAFAEFVFPASSSTVRVTVFNPRSTQVKLYLSRDLLKIVPLSSVELLSISLAVIVASPFESKYMVISCATATGGVVSVDPLPLAIILTFAVALALFPILSVISSVTVLSPKLLVSKL